MKRFPILSAPVAFFAPFQSFLTSASVFVLLVGTRNPHAWAYWLRTPGIFTWQSVSVIFRYDLLPIMMAGGLGIAAWGIGRRLLGVFLADERRSVAGLFFQLAAYGIGLGLIAYFTFILGLLGALRGPWLFVLGAALLAFAGIEAHRSLWTTLQRRRTHEFRSLPFWKSILIGLLAYAVWHALIAALAPATAFDVLTYHLALPKIYLQEGRILEIPWLIHSHWPHLMECLYLLPLWFGMDNVPALLHMTVSAALVVATFGAAREFIQDTTAAWIAGALLAAQPPLLYFAGTADVDGAFALFFFLSCVSVWIWTQNRSWRWLALGGLLSGLAASSKLHGLILLGLLTGWIWIHAVRSKSGHAWKESATFLICGLSLAMPWYLKTLLGTGNPVWPFFSNILGGRWGAAALEPVYIRGNSFGFPPELAVVLEHYPQYMVIPLSALAAVSLARHQRWPPFLKKFLLMLAVPYFLFFLRTKPYWRYMLPFLPALALTAGWAASHLARRQGWARAFAVLALAYGFFPIRTMDQSARLMAVWGWGSPSNPNKDSRTLYLENNLDHYRIFQLANRMLAPSSRILLFQETRGYYLDARYLWGDPINQGLIQYSAMRTTEELRSRLKQLGITHVFVNAGNPMFYEKPEVYSHHILGLMQGLMIQNGKLVLQDGPLLLFELKG